MLLDPLMLRSFLLVERELGLAGHERSGKSFYVVYWLGEFANNSPRTRLKGELSSDSRLP